MISKLSSAQTCRQGRCLDHIVQMRLGYSNVPVLCRVAEVRPPAFKTTSTHVLTLYFPVLYMSQDVIRKSTKGIDKPSDVLSRSHPADTFRLLKHPCALSRCGGTFSRVQHNLDSPPRPTSKGPEHVGTHGLENTQRMDMPIRA